MQTLIKQLLYMGLVLVVSLFQFRSLCTLVRVPTCRLIATLQQLVLAEKL